MKNIITAIGNVNLNTALEEDDYFNVVSQDIQYQEGIFELLEHEMNVEFLIISETISGELEFIDLIKKIIIINNKIKVYVILKEKNEVLENQLNNLKISNIFYSNQIEIKELIDYLKNEQKTEEEKLKEEIEKLKEIILKNNTNENKEKTDDLTKLKKKISKEEKCNNILPCNNDIKLIAVTGVYGSGKSLITLLISKYYEFQNKNVLVIDADIYNQSIHTILGMKIKNNNKENIVKVSKKISFFTDINDFLDSEKNLKEDKFHRFLDYIKNEYDILIFDTTSNNEKGYIKKLLKLTKKIILLVEPNLSEISKLQYLLDYYLYKLNINNEKINIILNKVNKNMIDENILKNIFFNMKIVGKIEYKDIYSKYINTNKIEELNVKKLLKKCKLD